MHDHVNSPLRTPLSDSSHLVSTWSLYGTMLGQVNSTSESAVIQKTYMQISHDPGSHDPDPGPQEKSMKKSCVSFETECKTRDLVMVSPLGVLLDFSFFQVCPLK